MQEKNPHTAAWMEHDYVQCKGWTLACLLKRASRYRHMWLTVFKPAVYGAEALKNKEDKQLAMQTLSQMISQLEMNLLS